MNDKLIRLTHCLQQDQSDCGVACLRSILRYQGGDKSLESLRELSGTTKQGTTMLGLYLASEQLGFDAKGCEGDFDFLRQLSNPVILHVILDNSLQHFVVCYGIRSEKFVIGDPAKGIVELSEIALADIWKSKSFLELIPTGDIEQVKQVNRDKWSWFKTLVKDDAGLLAIIFGISLIISILGMAMAVFSQQLIDDILPSKKVEKLVGGLILIVVLLIARGGLSYLAGTFGVRQSRDFNNRLINRFFNSLIFLPKSFFDSRRIGELVERMNDTTRIQSAIAGVVGELLKNFLLVLVGEVILFIYSPTLGLVSLLTFPCFGLLSWYYQSRISTAQSDVMIANAHKSSNYVDSIHGIETIKSNHKEKEFTALNQLVYGYFQDKIFSLGKVSISLQLMAEITSVFVSILLIAIGSWKIMTNELSIGTLMAVLGISSGIFPAVISLAFANITFQGAKIAFDRMYEFSSIKPEYLSEPYEIKDVLSEIRSVDVQDLDFRFTGRKLLIKGVSFSCLKGQMVALLGESGSGKTTILNILQRFYNPEGGQLSLDGLPFNQIPISTWREHIGVLPQNVNLFNGSLIYNICLSNDPAVMQKCYGFCFNSLFHSYFLTFAQGYNTLLGEQGINISGGQIQLVGLARALWNNPMFLILDEPTSAMDRNMENLVLDFLIKTKALRCVILVTHRVKIARLCDTVYVLENGRIEASGDHDKLMRSENFYSCAFRELMAMHEEPLC